MEVPFLILVIDVGYVLKHFRHADTFEIPSPHHLDIIIIPHLVLLQNHNRESFYLEGGSLVRKFLSFGENVNHVCVCYWDGEEIKCNYCSNLDMPLVEGGKMGELWAISFGEKIMVEKMEEYYEITKV